MASRDVNCSVCGRCFRRESDKARHKCRQGKAQVQTRQGTSADKARHKCTAERQKPVQEQEGAVECLMYGRWLRSRGGLAVHRCARLEVGRQTRSILEDQTTESLAVRSPVSETTRMRGASMLAENMTVECKECGRLPG